MEIIELKLEELTPYENNARMHADKDISVIANSIKEFGMNDPIGIWGEKNIIVEGHGRLLALKKLGYKTAPCIRLDHLSDEQRKMYMLAHNKSAELSEWDFSKLEAELRSLDFDASEFGFDFIEETEVPTPVDDDDFDVDSATQEEPFVNRGQVWKLGEHYLCCGDSTNRSDLEKLMNGRMADLLVTDPPYNVDYVGKDDSMKIINDNMDSESFRSFLTDAFGNAYSVMKEGAAFYVWYASREHVNFECALRDVGFEVKQQLIWNKNSLVLGRQDYQWKHEPCLYGWKGGASHKWYSDRSQTTVMDFDKPLRNDLHPTMKPIPMIAYQIGNSSAKGDLVIDLFGGSGTTLIACEQIGRKCCTMELDERYASVIIRRWEELTGKKAELIRE